MEITVFNARIEVKVPHLVRCVHCHCEYIYEVAYVGSSQGQAKPEYAEEKAREDLAKQLNDLNRLEAVPCPECFSYQPHMYQKAALRRYDHLAGAGCICLGLGPIAIVLAGVLYLVFGAAPLVALSLLVVGSIALLAGIVLDQQLKRLSRTYQPNEDDLPGRQKLARELAFRLVEFNTRQQSRVRAAYAKHQENPALSSRGRPKKLIVEWYVSPSAFLNGGTVSIPLSDQEVVTARVPENGEPGKVVETEAPATVNPFKVRLFAMRVHPSEYELDQEKPE